MTISDTERRPVGSYREDRFQLKSLLNIDGRVMSVSAQVEQYGLSAHADRDGLRDFPESNRDATVIVYHGDHC